MGKAGGTLGEGSQGKEKGAPPEQKVGDGSELGRMRGAAWRTLTWSGKGQLLAHLVCVCNLGKDTSLQLCDCSGVPSSTGQGTSVRDHPL